ncbi:MAG: hypothetical protein AAFU74_12095 [Bacteroidota bacterium]
MTVTPLFKKLNFKNHEQILVLNPPTEFEQELYAIKNFAVVETDIENIDEIEFVLAFVKDPNAINVLSSKIDEKLKGDGLVWFAYPKKTSKKHTSEISRDTGWEILGKYGFEGVRQVAIDTDWSALRFRKVEYIKTMKRKTSFAMTKKGKQKTQNVGSKK